MVDGQDLVFSLVKDADIKTDELFAQIKGRVTKTDKGIVYLRLGENYFVPKTLVKILQKIFGSGEHI